MALLLPPSYATANATRSFPKTKKYDARKDSMKYTYCRKNGHKEQDYRKKKYTNGMEPCISSTRSMQQCCA
jgi:hypothetical protein